MDRSVVAIYGQDWVRGAKASTVRMTRALESRGATVFPVGDGRKELVVAEIGEAIKAACASGKPTTILLDAHISRKKKPHTLWFAPEIGTDTTNLISTFAINYFKKPVDLFLLTCRASQVLPVASFFAKGSIVAAPCSSKGYVYNRDIKSFASALESDKAFDRDLSSVNMLYLFLSKAQHIEWPSLAVSTGLRADYRALPGEGFRTVAANMFSAIYSGTFAATNSRDLLKRTISSETLQMAAQELSGIYSEEKIETTIEKLKKICGAPTATLKRPYKGVGLSLLLAANKPEVI